MAMIKARIRVYINDDAIRDTESAETALGEVLRYLEDYPTVVEAKSFDGWDRVE